MKVHIYTDIDTLFGRACRIWMDVLLSAGHEVETIDLGTSTSAPLPNLGHSDVNLLICGIYAFERFGQHGLPKGDKNILWMLDPLTSDSAANVHNYKAGLFDAFANQLNAVIAMDAPIESYLMMADLADMPQACAALLKNAGKRQAMVTQAQTLQQDETLNPGMLSVKDGEALWQKPTGQRHVG